MSTKSTPYRVSARPKARLVRTREAIARSSAARSAPRRRALSLLLGGSLLALLGGLAPLIAAPLIFEQASEQALGLALLMGCGAQALGLLGAALVLLRDLRRREHLLAFLGERGRPVRGGLLSLDGSRRMLFLRSGCALEHLRPRTGRTQRRTFVPDDGVPHDGVPHGVPHGGVASHPWESSGSLGLAL